MLRRVFWVLMLAFVLSMAIPLRPAARLPEAQKADAAAIAQAQTGEELSLARLLDLSGEEDLRAVSVYVYGLPTDRLALAQGLDEPSRVTLWLDGLRPLRITTTYDTAGEYFDLSGRSAEQLDGMTEEQFLQNRAAQKEQAGKKLEELSQNLHNYIVNVESWN